MFLKKFFPLLILIVATTINGVDASAVRAATTMFSASRRARQQRSSNRGTSRSIGSRMHRSTSPSRRARSFRPAVIPREFIPVFQLERSIICQKLVPFSENEIIAEENAVQIINAAQETYWGPAMGDASVADFTRIFSKSVDVLKETQFAKRERKYLIL